MFFILGSFVVCFFLSLWAHFVLTSIYLSVSSVRNCFQCQKLFPVSVTETVALLLSLPRCPRIMRRPLLICHSLDCGIKRRWGGWPGRHVDLKCPPDSASGVYTRYLWRIDVWQLREAETSFLSFLRLLCQVSRNRFYSLHFIHFLTDYLLRTYSEAGNVLG